MIDYLLTFFKRVKINLTCWLHPLEEEVGRELLLLAHNSVVLFLREEVVHKFAVVSFTNKHSPMINLIAILQVHIIQRGICKNWKFIT